MEYEDLVRLAHDDFERRLDLVDDQEDRSQSFDLWMHSSFDLYGWFYLSLQFAFEGFEARRREAVRHGLFMRDYYSDVLCQSNDTLRYGVDPPTYYGYVARTCIKDAVALFELYVFCLLEERAGRPPRSLEIRTPPWSILCGRAREELGYDLDVRALREARDLRHRITHRLFGPGMRWDEEGLRPQQVLDTLDLLESHVLSLEDGNRRSS